MFSFENLTALTLKSLSWCGKGVQFILLPVDIVVPAPFTELNVIYI